MDEKLFTLELLDDCFEKLNLRECDGDKPSPIAGISLTAMDNNLRQHGGCTCTCTFLIFSFTCIYFTINSYADVDLWSFSSTCYWSSCSHWA